MGLTIHCQMIQHIMKNWRTTCTTQIATNRYLINKDKHVHTICSKITHANHLCYFLFTCACFWPIHDSCLYMWILWQHMIPWHCWEFSTIKLLLFSSLLQLVLWRCYTVQTKACSVLESPCIIDNLWHQVHTCKQMPQKCCNLIMESHTYASAILSPFSFFAIVLLQCAFLKAKASSRADSLVWYSCNIWKKYDCCTTGMSKHSVHTSYSNYVRAAQG